MDNHARLIEYLAANPERVGKVVDFDPGTEKLLRFDFSDNNRELSPDDVADNAKFTDWVFQKLRTNRCKFGIGGYFEHRTLYARSSLFNTTAEPRRLHLGIDIWGEEGTAIYSPLDGKIHSFQNNVAFGDYGPTIILEHDLNGLKLFSLYGHLSIVSLEGLQEGMKVLKNQQIARFGHENENGNWPPHLHFQLMFDMQGLKGDYPGVCAFSEKEVYSQNIPDPNLILKFRNETIM